MELESKKQGEVVLLKPISKNIDTTVTTDFKARIIDLINQGNSFFLLNLSKVDFIDSSGLGAIISILKMLTLNNGSLVLCELQGPIVNLFKLTKMDRVFHICKDEKEGIDLLLTQRTQNVSQIH